MSLRPALLLGALVIVPTIAAAQSARPLPLKRRARPTTAAITENDLMSRLYVFADDSMMGREAGTPGAMKGTAYIAAELKRIGLTPAGENGGYFLIPPPPPCAASDECHGAGTQAQAPPQIGSYKGTGGQAKPTRRTCRKGFKLKRGKCVKKRKHRKDKKGARRHNHGAGRGGNR